MSTSPLRKDRVQQVLLGVLTLLGAYLCFTIVQPFLMPAIAAGALAILFHPVHAKMRKLGLGPNMAAASGVVLILMLTLIPTVFLTASLARDLKSLYALLSEKSTADGGWETWLTHVLDRPLATVGIDVDDPNFSLKTMLLGWADAASATMVRILRGLAGNLAGVLFQTFVSLFTLYYLLRDGAAIRQSIKDLLPLDAATIDRLFFEVQNTVLANMYGVVAVAVVQGALTGVAFFGLGLPSPMLWGIVAGMCSMIPLVGPPIVWAPAAIYLAASGQYGKAAILAGLGLGVIGLADNFIRPYIVSGQVSLHPLLIFFALLGGAQSFGLMGIFIGPAALSVTAALFELLTHPAKHATPPSPESHPV
ncbi:MAG: AI-2E family transporter [Bryobacterales bacterium]|nr:AI-2E family transporter [Bryobacterales bacterium]